jgi:hypothetical protein
MFLRVLVFIFLFSLVFILACDGEDSNDQIDSLKAAQEQFSRAGEKLAESMKEMTEAMQSNSDIKPVPYNQLTEIFPDKVNDFIRTSAEGKTTEMMGINISEVQAVYNSGKNCQLKVQLTDMGNMSGLTIMAAAAWAFNDFSNENANEFERTTTFDGNKALEKYNKLERKGKVSILIAERFVLEVQGVNVEIIQISDFVKQIDLARLKSMIEK